MPRRAPDKDFLADCVKSLAEKVGNRVEPSLVTAQVCFMCRNPQCHRAGWSESKWSNRVETQEDRLLDHPQFSDLSSPEHMAIHDLAWKDLLRKAMRLEISAMRGDWEPVKDEDVPPTDGIVEVGSQESVNAVDTALAALAAKQGKPKPKIPRLAASIEDPTVASPPQSRLEQRYGNPSRKKQPTPEQAARMAARMGVSVDEDLPEDLPAPLRPSEPESELEAEAQPERSPPPEPRPQPVPTQMVNTSVPREGIMVGGPEPEKKPAADPWAPKKKENIVSAHAKIKMGAKKDD